MGAGYGNRYDQVAAFRCFGQDGAQRYGVRIGRVYADIALVLHKTLGCDVALHIVRIHGIGAHADGIFNGYAAHDLVFGHHAQADHPAAFPDIDLVGPVAVIRKLVPGQAPFLHFGTHVIRHPRVVGQEIEQSFLVGFVLADDFPALFVGGFRVIVAHADIVEAEGAVVVHVCFPVGDGVEFVEGLEPAGIQHPDRQFVLRGVVAGRFFKRGAVGRYVGQAGPETISLHFPVAFAVHARRLGGNAGQDAAGRVAGPDVGADVQVAEVVPVVENAGLHAVPLFVVFAVGFPAYAVGDACSCHQVAFVGGVDEDRPLIFFTAERGHGGNAAFLHFYAVFAVEPFVAINRDAVIPDEILENAFGDMGFKDPHGAIFAVDGGCALSAVAVILRFLP